MPLPDQLAGVPCSESGLFPVPRDSKTNSRNKASVHPLIRKRARLSKEDPLGRLILNRMERHLPAELTSHFTCEFFKNVSPEPLADVEDEANDSEADKLDDEAIARISRCVLGSRNRWAVVVMDGNSIGRHFKTLRDRRPEHEAELIGKISQAIRDTTEFAFDCALVTLIKKWFVDNKDNIRDLSYHPQGSTLPHLLIPVRPILLGGDDLILLCHCRYAMQFVQDMALAFETRSRELGLELQTELGYNPWEKNGDVLSISAGVLFTKSSLPLHSAIPYAEALLGNAKSMFRKTPDSTASIASSIDWDIITDSMVDHPSLRRQRESRFIDEDIDTMIQLTRRPYQIGGIATPSDWPQLEQLRQKVVPTLRGLPRAVLNELGQAMRLPWAYRARFLQAMGKNRRYRDLVDALDYDPREPRQLPMRWFESRITDADRERLRYRILETDIVDALGILEEEHRLNQQTVPS